jgi:hypothetical protein
VVVGSVLANGLTSPIVTEVTRVGFAYVVSSTGGGGNLGPSEITFDWEVRA